METVLQRGVIEEVVFSNKIENDRSTVENGVTNLPFSQDNKINNNPNIQFEFHDIIFCVSYYIILHYIILHQIDNLYYHYYL